MISSVHKNGVSVEEKNDEGFPRRFADACLQHGENINPYRITPLWDLCSLAVDSPGFCL